MNTTAAALLPTDSFRALARRYSTTPAALRAIAGDLGLAFAYSSSRRTWFLDVDATTVRVFNDHLAEQAI